MPRFARIPSGSLAAALLVYRTWSKLPPKQRSQLLDAARAHGPRVAAAAAGAARTHGPRVAAAAASAARTRIGRTRVDAPPSGPEAKHPPGER